MTWKSWMRYAHAAGYALHCDRNEKMRYRLESTLPGKPSTVVSFSSQRRLVDHLRSMAVHDLRRDSVIYFDAFHAALNNDYGYIRDKLPKSNRPLQERNESDDDSDADLVHTWHVEDAALLFRRLCAEQLDRAAQLHIEFRSQHPTQQYQHRLDQARARIDEGALTETLRALPVASTPTRAGL